MIADGMLAELADIFGWGADVVVSAGPRGALGQIWRVETGTARYALKELLAEPPPAAAIETELAFTRRAAAAGVRLPASHADRAGRYLSPGSDGRWFRLFDWVDLGPVDLAGPTAPARIGELFARMHLCAPAARSGPVDPWYDSPPAADRWAEVAAADTVWAARLAERVATMPDLVALVTPVDTDALVLCHRDLHPENVLADPSGALVVVDWDNLGPADPTREIAQALFDWFSDGDTDLDAVGRMYRAYVAEGGVGRITAPADFSMLIATRLNFLRVQTGVAIDPRSGPRDRAWADREIDEALRIMPTARQIADVVGLTRTIA